MYPKAWFYCSLRNYMYITGIPFSQGVFSMLSCFLVTVFMLLAKVNRVISNRLCYRVDRSVLDE